MSKKFAEWLFQGLGGISQKFADAGLNKLIEKAGLLPDTDTKLAQKKFENDVKLTILRGLMSGDEVDPKLLNQVISGEGLSGDMPITRRRLKADKSKEPEQIFTDTSPDEPYSFMGSKPKLSDIKLTKSEQKLSFGSKPERATFDRAKKGYAAQPARGPAHKILGGSTTGVAGASDPSALVNKPIQHFINNPFEGLDPATLRKDSKTGAVYQVDAKGNPLLDTDGKPKVVGYVATEE